jgi:transcriptional regulator with XRE-family HTH domain
MMKKKIDNTTKALSEKVRILRVHKDLTQKELAQELNISPQSISGYENGNVLPDVICLKKYAEYFHVSLASLLDLAEEKAAHTDDMPSSSEMQMIESYRRRPEWEKRVIRTLCFNGSSYRSEDEEFREIEEYAAQLTKKRAKGTDQKK